MDITKASYSVPGQIHQLYDVMNEITNMAAAQNMSRACRSVLLVRS